MLRHTVCHLGEQMLAAVRFCGGILERHPRLRVAFLEGNARAGYLPALENGRTLRVARRRLCAWLVEGAERVLQAAVLSLCRARRRTNQRRF